MANNLCVLGPMSGTDTKAFRTSPNRSFGECEVRRTPVYNLTRDFANVRRIYTAHPKSSKARKNKKRKMAYTHTKEYRKSVAPLIRYLALINEILNRKDPGVFEDFYKAN